MTIARTVSGISLGLGITLYATNLLAPIGLDSAWLDTIFPNLRAYILLSIPILVAVIVGL